MIVQRAGDVIPQVVGPGAGAARKRGPAWSMPERCPVCDSPVVRAEGEATHYCSNRACPSRGYEGLRHFVSRGAMDIDGVGEKLVPQADGGGARRPAAGLLPADRRRAARARRVPGSARPRTWSPRSRRRSGSRSAASSSRSASPTWGRSPPRRSRTGSARWTALREAGAGEIAEVEGVGPVIAEPVAGLVRRRRARRRSSTRCRGRPADGGAEAGGQGGRSGPLAGKTFVVTGTLEGHTATRSPSTWRAWARR